MSENSYQRKSFRVEVDSMGQINVLSYKYWGAQTQRALQHFAAGKDVMPYEAIDGLAVIKKMCRHYEFILRENIQRKS
jgi:fumarate hydratase class II